MANTTEQLLQQILDELKKQTILLEKAVDPAKVVDVVVRKG
jgi:hypothetical protein